MLLRRGILIVGNVCNKQMYQNCICFFLEITSQVDLIISVCLNVAISAFIHARDTKFDTQAPIDHNFLQFISIL